MATLPPTPQAINPLVQAPTLQPTQPWADYFHGLDGVIRNLTLGPLIDATSDAAAATAGVPLNGLYRDPTSLAVPVVRIRKV